MQLHCPLCHEWVDQGHMRLVKDRYVCDKCRDKAKMK